MLDDSAAQLNLRQQYLETFFIFLVSTLLVPVILWVIGKLFLRKVKSPMEMLTNWVFAWIVLVAAAAVATELLALFYQEKALGILMAIWRSLTDHQWFRAMLMMASASVFGLAIYMLVTAVFVWSRRKLQMMRSSFLAI